jgi:hypothetical protein
MIKIQVKIKSEKHLFNQQIINFYKINKPKRLTRTHNLSNKMERLLFISGLNINTVHSYISISMYTLKDFDKFLKVLKIYYSVIKFIYNREEVIKFFKN